VPFDLVIMRTSDGQEYGPVSMEAVRQWQAEGRVPMNAVLIDAETREERPAVSLLMGLAMPPPPMAMPAPTAPSATDHLIPTKNPRALIAYYLGVFGLIPCIVFIGIGAFILGIMGLNDAKTRGVGRTHAIVGIVLGGLEILGMVVGILYLISVANSG